MTLISEIRIPKDTVNDDEVMITEILVASGDAVAEGDLLLVYESSKASVEVEAPASGHVTLQCSEGEYAAVGSVIALITDTPGQPAKERERKPEAPVATDAKAPVFSQAAQRYMEKMDVDPSLFLGHDLVGLDDVLAVVGTSSLQDGRIPAVILGGGGHGLVLGDLVGCNSSFYLKGYLDDGKSRGDVVDGIPVLGVTSEVSALCRDSAVAALIAVGLVDPDPALRIRFFEMMESAGALLPPFVHASATVDSRATLGRGVQIHAGAVIGPDVVIEDGAVINTGVVVSHHCRIGKHTHVAPGAILAGGVSIGAGCLIGMGVTTYINISIGDNCVIENGANLFKSVPSGTRVSTI
ncbi:NeuD/PglB/VioB family sugar acetyltransferase [Pseudodesulfovibrio sp.]|nr:NeuD/PglB/VioB family sugar acetyltransferase [Pseudodesulfovibrio sp.]